MADYIITKEEQDCIISNYLALKHSGFGYLTIKIQDHRIIDVQSTYSEDHKILDSLYRA